MTNRVAVLRKAIKQYDSIVSNILLIIWVTICSMIPIMPMWRFYHLVK